MARKLLIALGIGCLVTGCWPSYATTERDSTHTARFSVGLPSSPWILFEREVTEERSDKGNFTSSFRQQAGVEFISWSMLLLLVSQLLFFLATKIRKWELPLAT